MYVYGLLVELLMKSLALKQFVEFLESVKTLKGVSTPRKGWIRAIRDGLGMNRRQLAERMGVSSSRVQRIESDELSDAVTLRTMRRTAEAMDCVFVYAILPKDNLLSIVEKQARKKALKQLQAVSHSMGLESQALASEQNQEMLDVLTQTLMNNRRAKLWDDE